MRISSKRQEDLFGVIHDEIMNVRIVLSRNHNLPAEQDALIAETTHSIWRRVKDVLDITAREEGD